MSDTGISPIRIGISTCLLGERVRFDGGHKKNAFLTDTFGQYVQWVPVCPEVEIGLGTPREPIRLEHSNAGVRLVTVNSGIDHTQSMSKFAGRRVRQLAKEQLCGYVFKKDSPSCGMVRVKVYSENGISAKTGRGLFANALIRGFPALPVEEEGRLCDPRLRENFVERVFAYHRLQQLFSAHWGVGALVQFHTAHKLQLMAHCPQAYQSLGRLVAVAKELPRSELRTRYPSEFMVALAHRATPRRHVNAMQHILGYFSKQLDSASRHELLSLIEDYRRELLPLIVPMTLLRHYVRQFEIDYLAQQTYLDPHPKELMLRNHV